MKLHLWIACALVTFALVAAIFPALAKAEAASRHVVMISIDGLRPEIYLAPEQVGVKVPNLVQLRDQGVSAERMIPVFPSVTYPGHTTLVTGVTPATHGIVNNFKRGAEWYRSATDIKATTLWQAARKKGLVTAIVTWPASYGAEVDYLIPENLSFDVKDVPQLIRSGATPGLFERLESQLGAVQISSFEHAEAGEEVDRMTGKFAAAVLRQYQPHFLLTHFLDADHRQHFSGPASAESNHAFELIDQQVGTLRQAAQDAGILDSTTFVIVGDHGFVSVHTSININGLLAATGFGRVAADGTFSSPGIVATPIGGAAIFQLAQPNDKQLATRLASAFRAEIQQRYLGLVDFVSRDELELMGALPGAVFALAAKEGYMFTAAPNTTPLISASSFKGMHGYLPSMPAMATGFIVSGAGVRKDLRIPLVRMLDVAPTVATLLGVELGEATGLPIAGIFESSDPGVGLGLGIETKN
ncbi:MAG: alkaline phosphatase family protein [Deltaproteobacteria bacterium]|nr:alkaline phosphatase family protein [Deltaproteobacteria bacterium]